MSQVATTQSDTKWEEAVMRMADLTNQGKIKWNAVAAADVPSYGYFTRTMAAYDASYAGKKLRIIETSFLSRPDNSLMPAGVSLRMIDEHGAALLLFPEGEAVIELLGAVKSQMADVDSFLQALYNE